MNKNSNILFLFFNKILYFRIQDNKFQLDWCPSIDMFHTFQNITTSIMLRHVGNLKSRPSILSNWHHITIPKTRSIHYLLGLVGLWCLTPFLTIFQLYRGGYYLGKLRLKFNFKIVNTRWYSEEKRRGNLKVSENISLQRD